MATDQNILAPGTPEAKAPLKRSTLIGVGVLIFVLMGVGAMVAQTRRGTAPPPAEDKLTVVGKPNTIDQESDRVVVREVQVAAPARSSDAVALEHSSPTKEKEKDPRDQLLAAGTMSRTVIADSSQEESALSRQRDQSDANGVPIGALKTVRSTEAESREKVIASNPAVAGLIAAAQAGSADKSASSSNVKWMKEYASEKPAASNKPSVVQGQYVLAQGMQIPAVLNKNIVSDLPGEITARVIVDVYDSFNGRHLLIPKGSLLVGQYNSGVLVGQSRLLFAFKRLVLPNRLSFDLPGATGMDLAGASGLEGEVDNHFFKMFGTSLLMAVLSWGVERGEPAPSGLGSSGGPRTAAGEALVEVSRSVLDRNRNISPTISIPAGTRLNVQVAGDMEFPTAYKGAAQ